MKWLDKVAMSLPWWPRSHIEVDSRVCRRLADALRPTRRFRRYIPMYIKGERHKWKDLRRMQKGGASTPATEQLLQSSIEVPIPSTALNTIELLRCIYNGNSIDKVVADAPNGSTGGENGSHSEDHNGDVWSHRMDAQMDAHNSHSEHHPLHPGEVHSGEHSVALPGCINNTLLFLNLYCKVDVRRQSLRGNAVLPNEVGPKPRLLAICDPEDVELALKNGATFAGLENILERISNGWTNFDLCVSTSIHMPQLVKVARILGPKRLMPNIKSGTLTGNLMETIRRLSSNKCVHYRAESISQDEYDVLRASFDLLFSKKLEAGLYEISKVKVPIGDIHADPRNIIANVNSLVIEIFKNRPVITAQKADSRFQWPPVRKSLNGLLGDVDQSLEESRASFILATALGFEDETVTKPLFLQDIKVG